MLKLYQKYREIINYLIAGIMTMIVSILSYALFAKFFHIYYVVSNVFSWILAVIFAYLVNKKYVFNSKTNGTKQVYEFINFIKYRALSLIIDTLLMYIFVDLIKVNDIFAKILVQFVVVILNYLFSKFLIFKEKE